MFNPKMYIFNGSHLNAEEKRAAEKIKHSLETLQADRNSKKSQLLSLASHYGLDVVWCDEVSITVIFCGREIFSKTFSSVKDLEDFIAYLISIGFFDMWENGEYNPEDEDKILKPLYQAEKEFEETSQSEQQEESFLPKP